MWHVVLTMQHTTNNKVCIEHGKLDNDIISNAEHLYEGRGYMLIQLQDAQHMGAHTKLEFAKMSIHTKALEIMHWKWKKTFNELQELDEDIKQNTDHLTKYLDVVSQDVLTQELAAQVARRDAILQMQGSQSLSGTMKVKIPICTS
jgi:hypothetical protein